MSNTIVTSSPTRFRSTLQGVLASIAGSTKITFVVVWAALSIASIAWGISTPLGASPDEPAHIIKAASVARGELIGDPTAAPAVTRVRVPIGLSEASSWTCYAFNPAIGANCIGHIDGGLKLHTAFTSAGLYNPTYYAIVGWPALFIPDPQTAVFAMRAVSGILSSLFLAFAFTILLRLVHPVIAGAAFFTALTPMVLFLSGAVNPNSLEIATGAAFAVGLLYVVLDGHGPRQLVVLGFTAASGFLLANARGISPLWMALIGIAVLIVSPWSRTRALFARRSVLIAVGVMFVGVILAGVWLLRTGSLGSMGVFPGAGKTTPVRGFYEMLVNRTFDPGVIGVFGWLDTPAPNVVYFIWIGLFAAIIAGAFALARGRTFYGFLFALASLLLVPPVVQALSVEKTGYIWQGRYTLVAFVFTAIMGAVAIGRSRFVTSSALSSSSASGPVSGFVAVIVSAVFVGQVYCIVTAVNRYSGGTTSSIFGFLNHPAWTPPGGTVIWLVLLSIGLAVPLAIWYASQALPVYRVGIDSAK